jgi:hypothetical protein
LFWALRRKLLAAAGFGLPVASGFDGKKLLGQSIAMQAIELACSDGIDPDQRVNERRKSIGEARVGLMWSSY